MAYFFRGIEDGGTIPIYGLMHITILALWLLAIYMFIKKSDDIREKFPNEGLLKIFALILLLDQIILYGWQFGSGYFRFDMSLPIYHCRVAVWIIIFGVFSKNKLARSVGIYWGLIGGVLAFFVPDIYKFTFPHYTNFQFFIAHFLLGFTALYYIVINGYSFPKKDLRLVLGFTTVYNFFLLVFNKLFLKQYPKINYGYFSGPPPMLVSKIPISGWLYSIFLFVAYNLVICLIYLLGRALCKLTNRSKKGSKQTIKA